MGVTRPAQETGLWAVPQAALALWGQQTLHSDNREQSHAGMKLRQDSPSKETQSNCRRSSGKKEENGLFPYRLFSRHLPTVGHPAWETRRRGWGGGGKGGVSSLGWRLGDLGSAQVLGEGSEVPQLQPRDPAAQSSLPWKE